MPQGGLGYSFNPSQPDLPMSDQGAPGRPAGGLTPQQAVKMLSLRIPERPSPTGLAPMPLLQSPGGAGMQGLDSLIAALLQAFGGAGMDLGTGSRQTPGGFGPGRPTGGMLQPSGMFPAGQEPDLPPLRAPGPPRISPGSQTGEGPFQPIDLPNGFQSGTDLQGFELAPLPQSQPTGGGVPERKDFYGQDISPLF
jgi:hypothetical protein